MGKVAVRIGSVPRTEEIFSCQQYCCRGGEGLLKIWVPLKELAFLGPRIPASAASVPHHQHVGKYYSPKFLPGSDCIPEVILSLPAYLPCCWYIWSAHSLAGSSHSTAQSLFLPHSLPFHLPWVPQVLCIVAS